MRPVINVAVGVGIPIVVALLLLGPLVGMREAEAQTRCNNNLRQLALALHNYHDSYQRFPQGALSNDELPVERRLSFHFGLIPYIEAIMDPEWVRARKQAWDARCWDIEVALHFNTRQMSYFLCSANSEVQNSKGYGLTHYVGVAGIGLDSPMLPTEDSRAGVFGYERMTRLEDITNGRNTTMLMIETATANGPWAAGGPSTVRGLDPNNSPYLGRDGQFSSRHRSRITNAMFVDGSVHSLDESVAPEVLQAFASIAMQEAVQPVPDN